MTRSISIYCSYAHEDREFRNELAKHLSTSDISSWHDRDILPGTNWISEIDPDLNKADIILLLISVDFIASDYCYGAEMYRALQRHEAGEAVVIPIIIRPVDWEDAPFSRLQILPVRGQPISRWKDANKAYENIVQGIRQVIKEIIIQKYIKDAESLMNDNNFKSALSAYEEALQFGQDDPVLYQGKATIHSLLGQYDDALSAYQQTIRLQPDRAQIWRGKGNTLVNLNRFEEALEAYEQAIRLDPGNPYLYKERGDVLSHLERLPEALASYDHAIDLKPDLGTAYLSKGRVLEKIAQQMKQLAEESYRKANEAKEESERSIDGHGH